MRLACEQFLWHEHQLKNNKKCLWEEEVYAMAPTNTFISVFLCISILFLFLAPELISFEFSELLLLSTRS